MASKKPIMRIYNYSHFNYTRSYVSYSKTDRKFIKNLLEGRTGICCNKFRWFL